MKARTIKDGLYWVGAVDWDRRLFDSLVALPHGTSYNAYLVRGGEKTALIDTVDPSMASVLLGRLDESGVEDLDYVIANHAEQDHSGALPHVLAKYPNAKVVATANGKRILASLLRIADDRFIVVEDGDSLELGGKTLRFIHTPWVHWPETMVTYLAEDHVLFSCDFFGSHVATSNLHSAFDERVCEAAKAYYAQVMMPFRGTISRNLEKVGQYPIDLIAPSHGPLHSDPACIVESYRDWVSDRVSNTVVLAYVSMHGSTELMADYLTEALSDKGVAVEKMNLAAVELGKLAAALVGAATLVIGSPTVLGGAHPQVVSAVFLANALKPKVRFASIIGSYAWGGKMVDQITGLMANLKVQMLQPVVIKGYPTAEDFGSLEQLAREIAARHAEIGIV